MARRGVTLLLAVVLAGLAACTGSGYHYVTSKKTGLYLKVPTGWRVFDKNAIVNGLKNNGTVVDDQTLFIAAFDGASKPSVLHAADPAAASPTGLVRVKQLTGQERDVVSFQALRNLIFSVDDGVQQDKVKVLGQADLTPASGLRGQRYVYEVAQDTGASFVVDQTVLVDNATSRLFVLAVTCEATCYQNNRKDIDKVVTSWTVKKG
jgi:hypothetical protein